MNGGEGGLNLPAVVGASVVSEDGLPVRHGLLWTVSRLVGGDGFTKFSWRKRQGQVQNGNDEMRGSPLRRSRWDRGRLRSKWRLRYWLEEDNDRRFVGCGMTPENGNGRDKDNRRSLAGMTSKKEKENRSEREIPTTEVVG